MMRLTFALLVLAALCLVTSPLDAGWRARRQVVLDPASAVPMVCDANGCRPATVLSFGPTAKELESQGYRPAPIHAPEKVEIVDKPKEAAKAPAKDEKPTAAQAPPALVQQAAPMQLVASGECAVRRMPLRRVAGAVGRILRR